MYIAMSTELPSIGNERLRNTARITIVAATYNEKYTTALLDNCLAELKEYEELLTVNVVRVPGAFEVPMMVKRAIATAPEGRGPNAVIALGVILRGSTAHADLIGDAITRQLLSISCDALIPVIHEVLLLDNEQQAFARCIAAALNRGREAARAAIEMLRVLETEHALGSINKRTAGLDPHGSLLS